MADFSGKYTGVEVEELLDQVAKGSFEDGRVYVWNLTENINIGSGVAVTGNITQDEYEAIKQAETVILKSVVEDVESTLVGNTKMLSNDSVYIVFDMHFVDKLVQYHFNIIGTTYSLTMMESPIITNGEWEDVNQGIDKIPEIKKLVDSHNKKLEFFAIEPVTVIVDGIVTECAANEVSTVFVGDKDFEIIPTSNSSIKSLLGYPIPLTWHDWLEGVDVFENIIFDMNNLDTYKHWIQYYQGDYHVQKAQYSNCVFWSDKPYTHSPFEERTNYTIYYSAELPMCYSTIPNNTYKPFYLAYGVKTDPNWNNPDYVNSYSIVSGATQTFSYYGATAIGIFDMGVDLIKLPKDCRGLMYHAPAITHAGVFDAINTTNFGAKKGSWQEAFGDCISLTSLYIKNLKTSINISWSPINNESIEFILNNAANTSAITISVSPYTWYRLTDAIRELATSKNITLALISTNYVDDSRWVTKQDNLVSGENIKTVNGESILGSGNVQIDLSGYATTQDLEGKVDKVDGKQLSTEDFTTVLKNKLDGLNNYDDTTISQAVDKLRTDLDALVSGDTTTAIKTFNEVIAFLDGISDTEDLSSIIASIEQQIAGKMDNVTLATVATSGSYNDLADKPTIPDVSTKQDTITDLDTIRSGAEKGATAVQPSDLYNDSNGEIIPRLIAKRGLIEDTEVGFTYALPFSSEESLGDADTTLATTDLAEQIARSVAFIEEEDSSSIVTRAKNGLFQVEVDGELGEIFALPNLGEDLQGEADHVLATDKDIQQLDGKVYVWKPTSFVLNSTFSVSGDYWWIKNSKIVILDLGTTRYISAPITIDASGNITLNFVNHTATGMQIITALIDTNQRCTTSASSVTFPTIDEKESWSGKQEKLVSGTNIKTINGNSLLGSGNITISGGGSGTITGVSANGTSIATSGVANIPAASTSAYGVTKLTTATNSTSTTLAATASAVKSAYDLANSYKGTITAVKVNGSSKSPSSGTVDIGNVVTSVKVNGSTYSPSSGVVDLGTISGGGGTSGGGAYTEVNHGTSDTTFTLTPNTFHVWDEVDSLTLILGSETTGVVNEFLFQFTSGATATTLTLPDDIKWANASAPTIAENMIYQVSILKGLASVLSWLNNSDSEDSGSDGPDGPDGPGGPGGPF